VIAANDEVQLHPSSFTTPSGNWSFFKFTVYGAVWLGDISS